MIMPAGTRDLWPTDIASATPTVIPPSEILQQQATNLERKTQGVLLGKVNRWSSSGQFFLSFRIVAPALDYEYELLKVHHGIDLYPVTVDAALGRADVQSIYHVAAFSSDMSTQLGTEEQFVQWLENVLADDQTRKVIGSLLRQSGVPVGVQ
jgi:hypothetical protein